MKNIAVINGSLRKDSLNRTLAEAIAGLAAESMRFQFVEIGDLPLYNEDLWAQPPESVLRLKREVEAADAVLFVTPEYNRSFSPAIKNAIDWGTRPWGQNSWESKPSAVIGTSPGAGGAMAGQNALKSLLTVVDTVQMGQPEVYFQFKPELFAADGSVADEKTREFLMRWVRRFDGFIERVSPPKTSAQADAA
ncbi:NADPH-dependent FMN reductase [Aureimonas populi]|uniref:NADPH-dependent FMN reductase n=1 Tax=Aureimonas populi TaxID=1701758 RepID=A0ABW5CJ08_9HYPH|nr:NAD(P)H-dependent oxidoreductase [Aureimonas populi]